jgi:hypothetical protein
MIKMLATQEWVVGKKNHAIWNIFQQIQTIQGDAHKQ